MPNPTPEDLLGLTEAEGRSGGLDKFLNQPGSEGGKGWGMLTMLQTLMSDPGYAPFAAHAVQTSRMNTPEGHYYGNNLYGLLQQLMMLRNPPSQGLGYGY